VTNMWAMFNNARAFDVANHAPWFRDGRPNGLP